MLTPTVLVPEALVPPGTSAEAVDLFCSIGIGLLRDLNENGVIITNVEPAALRAPFEAWPLKHQKRGMELLKRLALNNRIVKAASGAPSPQCPSSDRECTAFAAVSASSWLCALIASRACDTCSSFSASAVPTFRIDNYPLSDYYDARSEVVSALYLHGEKSQTDFEALVLAPLFRFAKHVKLVDRYIGRSVADSSRSTLSKTYNMSLCWLVECFARHSCAPKTFQVLCGIDTSKTSPHATSNAVRYLRTFERQLATIFPHSTIVIKDEATPGDFPHSRHVITDQAALLVERGFDLLWSDREMRSARLDPARDVRRVRDVMIALWREPSRIETAIRRLRDL